MSVNCKQCGIVFSVDENFYKKICLKFGDKAVEMPLPGLCPQCRNIRRMMFRNDRSFYHRKCDLSGKQFVSMYDQDATYKVYHPDEWYSDKWNALDYGREFDFSRGFFEQFGELMQDVPRLGIDIVNCENSYYCNYCGDDKNCYLDIAGEDNEDCYYNLFVKHSTDVVDCTFVYNSTLCYECINCYDCYGCQHSMYCDNCSDCLYCFDLKGCKDCVFSHGLRNKQYCVFNEQKTKEEYEAYLNSLHLGSFEQRKKLMAGWVDFKRSNALHRANYFLNCENVSGDNLKNCKNVFESFNVGGSEDCRYLYDVLDATDCSDLNYSLYKPELSYELISTLNMVKSAFSMASHYNNEIFYCDLVNNSSHLFGCIGLNHGEYCILNKQYSREEYEELVPKIIEHMKRRGEWGEFFPVELSPFAYNETVVDEYFPLGRDEIEEKGWVFKEDNREKMYKGPELKVPDDIADAGEFLVESIFVCEKSEKPFKVIVEELNFYKRMNLPVPRRSPVQRHRDRMGLRNPRSLFERSCVGCAVAVDTTYDVERKEQIYCEKCYLEEVY